MNSLACVGVVREVPTCIIKVKEFPFEVSAKTTVKLITATTAHHADKATLNETVVSPTETHYKCTKSSMK